MIIIIIIIIIVIIIIIIIIIIKIFLSSLFLNRSMSGVTSLNCLERWGTNFHVKVVIMCCHQAPWMEAHREQYIFLRKNYSQCS